MLNIGKFQTLWVNRIGAHGAYLTEVKNGDQEVLLPKALCSQALAVDDTIEAFVYMKDKEGLLAHLERPLLQRDEIGTLEVKGRIEGGFFLGNGSVGDVFLPKKLVKGTPELGRRVMVRLRLDSEQRLYATMKIFETLSSASPYAMGQRVDGIVYELHPEMGAFVAVDDQYQALVPQRELYKDIKEGARLSFRITRVREDGKLNLSLRDKAAFQIDSDMQVVLAALETGDGHLYLDDYSAPESIRKKLNMSKKAYKRAVGRLMSSGQVEQIEGGIKKTSI